MKNLSAIPRLSLFAAYSILITLVVCLGGFTGAEAHIKFSQEGQDNRGKEDGFYRRQPQEDASNIGMYSQKSSKLGDDGWSQQRNFASYFNYIQRDIPLDMIMKRHSQDFDESAVFDSDKENDGYGYDDDEYYHFNYKRNDDASQKSDKEGVGEMNKDKLNSQTFSGNKVQTENAQKETKTIEMLNYKEMHPNPNPNLPEMQNVKPYSFQGIGQKKSLAPEPMDTLKISDLKENSALGEKIKNAKEEGLASPNEPKITEVKKSSKVMEGKDNLNMKDSTIVKESENKEAGNGLQDKSSLSSKSLKESARSTEEKEKIEPDVKSVKLSESAKIIEGIEKISKSKEGETAKITKEDKDNSRFYDRLNSEIISSNDFSQLNNRVNLVSGDYKGNLEQLKRSSGMEEDEKNSEELNENDRNVNLNDYSDETRERKDILKGSEYANNYGVSNSAEDTYSGTAADFRRNSELFGIPLTYDPREFFTKRESWKSKSNSPTPGQQIMAMGGPSKDYHMNLPKIELENTEYHKNFMKSLKRYKSSEDQKSLSGSTLDKNSHTDKLPEEPFQKLSKSKREFLNYGDFENMKRDKGENEHFKFRRHAYPTGDMFARDSRLNFGEDRRKMQFSQQRESQPYDSRLRRRSPNIEYELKPFNEGPSFEKDYLRLNSMKAKKEIKKKFGDQAEGNVVKQYPYSQVSRDYLSKFGQFNNDKIFKRKAPLWKRREQIQDESRDSDSTGRNKGAPVGYYSNRVKFGQKVVNRNDEEQGSETTKLSGISQLSSSASYEKGRNSVEKSWSDSKNQNLKHDPTKRYDDKDRGGNPLLLVKKDKNGERLAKAFTDMNAKAEGDEDLNSDQLAKILSKDSDYVILKKKEKNKYQKLNENQGSLDQSSSMLHPDAVKSDKMKLTAKHDGGQRSDRGLYIRSYHSDEESKKFNANKVHPSGTKSNLRKTFEKFRDLANLFRDNEQDSSDNQRQSSEAKASGEIVFSEDRMPDPIVISNDVSNKLGGFKPKSSNSISNISNNFKTLDQNKKTDTAKDEESGKNMFTSEVKTDNTESSWEPALKNAFPEAKSVNSVQKNGNEIIVLDFNQNQLKSDASKALGLGKQPQPIGSGLPSNSLGSLTMGGYAGNSYGGMDPSGFFMPGSSSGTYQQKNPLISQGDRQVEVILHEGALPTFLQGDSNKPEDANKELLGNQHVAKLGLNGQNGAYAIFTGTPNEAQITIPIYPYPANGKNSMDKKTSPTYSNFKTMTKKNSDYLQQNDIANNVNQLMKDFKELSKLYQTDDNGVNFGHTYSNDVTFPSNSFTELSSNSDNKMKYLQNLLQSIMSTDKAGEGTLETGTYQNDNVELDENAGDTAYQVQDLWTKNNVGYDTDPTSKRQGKWTSAVGKNADFIRYQSNKVGFVPDEVRQDISKLLQSNGFKTAEKDEYQDSLWEELSEASDKIQRLRREGADKGKLKKTIEDALSYRERRQSDTEKKLSSESQTGENNKKLESTLKADESKSQMMCDKSATSLKEDKNADGKSNVQGESQMKEGDNKGSHESKRSVTKSDLESHLTDLRPEDEVVNSNYSATKRRKRRHVDRRKRSLHAKNKVSTADIKNEILKNLAEDNYQSVYSSGIRRKLLSIQDDEDADNYINSKRNDEQLVTGETQLQSVNEPINSGIDPTILTLFDATNGEKENRRERRSLNSAFHSNYKREIDLDESMPNDFQNFLVTSLGGFGSQKREVVKKEEALWEGKDIAQDNFNQIVDSSQSGHDSSEDSALEKRDVSKSEKHRHESFRDSNNYFNDESGKEISRLKSVDNHSRKKARSQDSSKTPEFEEDKNPTHIRIQVTNASTKEKKSSKPIMDESENTSTETENLPKEKEFLDKNKVRVNKAQKIYSLRDPKIENSNSVHLEGENSNDSNQQKVFYDSHSSHKRKKKKYIEENAMKPTKSFMTFDQKAMESLLKKYFNDQSSSYSITTQKMPVGGSHLPQVETVYNPAQGGNKAQLDKYRASSLKEHSKTSASSKNNLKSNTPDSYDGETLRSYLQDKPGKTKSAKENVKSYVEADWKPISAKSSLILSSDDNMQSDVIMSNLKSYSSNFPSSNPSLGSFSSQSFDKSGQTMWSNPGESYMRQKPSSDIYSSNALYDVLKLKQEMQNYNNFYKENALSKSLPKLPMDTDNIFNKQDDKSLNNIFSQSPSEITYNYDYFFKNPLLQKYKTKDLDGNNIKGISKQRIFENILKLKSTDLTKKLALAPQQVYTFDNGKDLDYLDTLEDEYLDNEDNTGKQESQEAASPNDIFKKFTKMFVSQHSKGSGDTVEGTLGEEELEEDYDENNDDEEDYSLITGSNDPDSGSYRENDKLQSSFRLDDSLYPKPVSYDLQGSTVEQAQFKKSDNVLDPTVELSDVSHDLNPFGGSSSVLRKINENSHNFGESLIKNLNKYNYDETWKEIKDKDLNKISGSGFEIRSNSKIDKRKISKKTKLKRNPLSEIGNRIFYASKTEAYDTKDLNGGFGQGTQSKTGRSVYYRMPKRNPMNAELRGAENEFEYESEGNGKHFTGNLVNGGKDNSDGHDATKLENSNQDSNNDSGTNKRNSENSENVDDVKENLEDDGETMAEDNILENVIGKYIMRKSVKDLSRFNGRDEKKLSEDPIKHNLKKRSLEDILGEDFVPEVKVLRKRLSSGHLTESNFRKYHKKNPNKRNLKDLDKETDPDVSSNDIIKEDQASDMSDENKKEKADSKQVTLSSDENEVKRSALDIFKKITNKDKDAKKSDDLNVRTVGFEPILSPSERSVPSLAKEGNKEGFVTSSKKNSDSSSKLLSESKEMFTEEKKAEKLDDISHKASSAEDGPWRIELKEKDVGKSNVSPGKYSEKKLKSTGPVKDKLVPSKTKQDLKTFIMYNKNVNAAKRSSESEEATGLNSEKSQRELDNSFWANSIQDTLPEKNIRKRSLKSSDQVLDTVEDSQKTEVNNDISTTETENLASSMEFDQVLPDTSSLSEDFRSQVPQNSNNFGFGNAGAKFQQYDEKRKFFSSNGSSTGNPLFPIPNDANIIGDNMHLNEETSKYLGQQIVDAILAQATTDPRFKKFIAPGLTVKAPHPRRQTQDDGQSPQRKDFSDQVQTLMQTVMSDLEKLAEKHVKKRMCNHIDDHSKQFLHFLLDPSVEKMTQTRQVKNKIRSVPNLFTRDGAVPEKGSSNMVEVSVQEISSNMAQPLNKLYTDLRKPNQPSQSYQTEGLSQNENEKSASRKDAIFLMKKKSLLAQLLKNYQYLKDSDLNEDYGDKFRALASELDSTNKELATVEASLCKCRKKKPPKCPSPCPFPCPPPCPPPCPCPCPLPPPPCPCPLPPPFPCPCPCPCPCPSASPTDKDLGLQCPEVELEKPPAIEIEEGTSETGTKKSSHPIIYEFEPKSPLNNSREIPSRSMPKPKFTPHYGFETVEAKKVDSEALFPIDPSKGPTESNKAPANSNTEPSNSNIETTNWNTEPPNLSTYPPNSSTYPPNSSTEPTNSNTELPNSSTEPANSSTEPTNSNTEPPNSSTEPADSNVEPADSSKEPPDSNIEPADSNKEPPDSTMEPVESNKAPTDSNKEPSDTLQEHRILTTHSSEGDLRNPAPFDQTSVDFEATLYNFPPTEFPVTFKYPLAPSFDDMTKQEDALVYNLPINYDGLTANSSDWTKGDPMSQISGLSYVGYTGPKFQRTQNTLNNYYYGQVPYHYQFMYPEGASFRRNFYDKNVIPTDKNDDSASQKISGDNFLEKNRRSSRNTKNKWLSLRNFRQDDNIGESFGEERRKIRELHGWWRPKTQKQNQRTYLAQNANENNEEEDPGMEYLVWSSMPAVRRRLNNMEPVIDLDRITWPELRRRNLPEGGMEQGRQNLIRSNF